MSFGAVSGGSSITALLGPTNTGKTHRAIERMLEHRSGMLGLPLRLLAREVYDRITTSLGESRVALVTGEEKRVPRRPHYWVCTVEAMPTDLSVDFLAIDEVQLAAHLERGHVFTDRLLHARGTRETWLLGAETMRPMIEALVPHARVASHPRLSTLSSAGRCTIAQLPPRSAVIAFSMPRVYELAERIRNARGGAAVVLGALSPRARNAQVAMYQAGEVSTMVATDAIGMGLNLDIDHVAFADVRKFDGREARPLDSDEIAQIAGRAGRYTRAGTFGTLAPLPELPEPIRRSVEAHRFSPVRHVVWRNSDLDFDSLDALIAALRSAPAAERTVPSGRLRRVEHADDFSALAELSKDSEVRARAQSRDRVALLWDVCQIPDYRKLWLEDHPRFLRKIFEHLTTGKISESWMTREIEAIDDLEGDIDDLMRRLAYIRTWTYVAHRADWIDDPERWEAATRGLEDRLSDALHDRLVARFVDRVRTTAPVIAKARPAPGSRPGSAPRAARDPSTVVSNPFEQLRHMSISVAGAPPRPIRHDAWVDALVEADHDDFRVDAAQKIWWTDRPVARLCRGPDLLRPEVKLALPVELGAGGRARVARRLTAWSRDWVSELLAPLRDDRAVELSAPGRGLLYQLEQRLGTVMTRSAREQIRELGERDITLLYELGVRLGACTVYLPKLLKPRAVSRRVALALAYAPARTTSGRWPDGGVVSLPRHPAASADLYVAMGYPVFGRRVIRADIADRLCAHLPSADLTSREQQRSSALLGCPAGEVQGVIAALRAARADGPAGGA